MQRLAAAGLRALVISPLLAQGTVFGVLVAARQGADSFSSNECEFLRQLSDHVALATHQAQLYATLQQAYDDLQQSQQTVMQQERLRALGQMASGVAHDINNAIAPIALYTDSLLEHEAGLSERARGYLNIIRRAIADVGETVKGMREFYRPQDRTATLTQIDMNPIVAQVIELTRVRWRDLPQQRGVAIAMRTELQQPLTPILGQESEIRDALTNLIFNAVDAMPDGGTLTVRTRGSAETMQLEVADSGVGMDEETRRRCLEPFFTTKGERGTGLGLAMVYGMVRRHSAELEIDSTLHQGTTMRIIFPAAQAAAAAAPGAVTHETRAARVVDPDRRRRSAGTRIAARHTRKRRPQGDGCRWRSSRHRHLRGGSAARRSVRRRDHGSRHAAHRRPPRRCGDQDGLGIDAGHLAHRLGAAAGGRRRYPRTRRSRAEQAAEAARPARCARAGLSG